MYSYSTPSDGHAQSSRRPWSPDPQSAAPLSPPSQPRDYYGYPFSHSDQRREVSDVSVEALDLADYARTLQQRPSPYHQPSYIPESHSPPLRLGNNSLDSLVPPSLLSRDTLSSRTSAPSRHTPSAQSQRRPFSLPPSSHSLYNTNSPYSPTSGAPRYSQSRIGGPSSPEVDMAHFPSWSKDWYQPDKVDPYSPTSFQSAKGTPFDPSNISRNGQYTGYSPAGFESERDLLPWSNDPPDYESNVDSQMKEERVRMLEHEFGGKSGQGGQPEEQDQLAVGSVTSKGTLVTKGPRKRVALRVVQVLLSLTAAIPSIYAAIVIKPEKPDDLPPPSGKPAAYVLYVVSCITFLALFSLFALRPCCCSRRKASSTPSFSNPGGMMVMPVQSMPGGQKKKKGKKGKGGPMGGDVQVNLIVDPSMFGGRGQGRDENEYSEDDGSWEKSTASGGTQKRRRRGIFAGLAMEEEWKAARSWLKKLTAFDCVGLVVWGAVFVLIMIGQRCPTGEYNGWCNTYNVSTAAACLLCVAFGVNIFFDVQDLHSSKASPRTRA